MVPPASRPTATAPTTTARRSSRSTRSRSGSSTWCRGSVRSAPPRSCRTWPSSARSWSCTPSHGSRLGRSATHGGPCSWWRCSPRRSSSSRRTPSRCSCSCRCSAFWFARRDRWAFAALAGAGAALTRSVGVVLDPGALCVEAIQQWRREGRSPLPRRSPRPPPSRSAPRCTWAGGPARTATRSRRSTPSGLAARRTAAPWALGVGRRRARAGATGTWWLFDLLVVGFAVAGLVLAARRIRPAYTVYAAGLAPAPAPLPFTGRPLLSVPRFVAVVFPVAWGWSLAASRSDRPPEPAVLGASAALFGLVALLFIEVAGTSSEGGDGRRGRPRSPRDGRRGSG